MEEVIRKVRQTGKITPLLQTVLVKLISMIIENLVNSDILGAWNGLETLINFSPPGVKKKYIEESRQIDDALKRNFGFAGGMDWTLAHAHARKRMSYFLTMRVKELSGKVMDALYEGGYLEKHREFEEGEL